MTASSPTLYCLKTDNGDFICEITDGPVYDYRSIFQMVVVRAVKGRLNAANRMMVPEWKLNRVTAANDYAKVRELEEVVS